MFVERTQAVVPTVERSSAIVVRLWRMNNEYSLEYLGDYSWGDLGSWIV